MSTDRSAASDGYRWCRERARRHYENFPVASKLLPAQMREPVAVIYAFARTADDIADEGDMDAPERLRRLAAMEQSLRCIESGQPVEGPVFTALADTVARRQLPLRPFHDLLDAFRQDVQKTRYANFGELMEYCRQSANPVGQLLLHLNGSASARNLALSDAVCSALQLINFLQDIAQDYDENNRIYLPLDEMKRFGVSETDIRDRVRSSSLRGLLQLQIRRADNLLRSGSPLGKCLGGRFGLEIRAIILGGARILEKLHAAPDPFCRPRLTRPERLAIAWKSVIRGFT